MPASVQLPVLLLLLLTQQGPSFLPQGWQVDVDVELDELLDVQVSA